MSVRWETSESESFSEDSPPVYNFVDGKAFVDGRELMETGVMPDRGAPRYVQLYVGPAVMTGNEYTHLVSTSSPNMPDPTFLCITFPSVVADNGHVVMCCNKFIEARFVIARVIFSGIPRRAIAWHVMSGTSLVYSFSPRFPMSFFSVPAFTGIPSGGIAFRAHPCYGPNRHILFPVSSPRFPTGCNVVSENSVCTIFSNGSVEIIFFKPCD